MQELFARARVLVTDYSSIAFNAAYLERPVVYFQFDADEVLAGGHVGRAGYFDYAATASVRWRRQRPTLCSAISRRWSTALPLQPYAKRIEATFPRRDGSAASGSSEAVRQTSATATQDSVPTPVLRRGRPRRGQRDMTRATPRSSPSPAAARPATTSTHVQPGLQELVPCDLATNQTSMISLMSPPIEVTWHR